jgi:uncharacterized protein with PIN domain
VNFLFDNNVSHPLARALRLLNQPVTHVRDIDGLGPAAPDDLVLNYAARRGYFVITKDRQILRTPAFRAIIAEEGVGIFILYVGRTKQLRAWEEAKLVVKAWDNVLLFAERNSPPFTAAIQRSGRVKPIRSR